MGLMNRINTTEELPFANDAPQLQPPQAKIYYDPKSIDFKTPLPRGVKGFPIHSSLGADIDLYLDGFPCPPNWEQVQADLKNADDYLKGSTEWKGIISRALTAYNLTDDWEKDQTDLERCFRLGDFAIMDYLNNPKQDVNFHDGNPDNLKFYKLLERCYSLKIYYSYKNATVTKVTMSSQVKQIKTWFANKVSKNETEFPLKYVQYSAHDDTLASHLIYMKIADPDCVIKDLYEGNITKSCNDYPPVASNIIWELIEANGEYRVKWSYNGEYYDYCKNNKTDSNGQFYCTLEEFNTMADNEMIYPKYYDYCGIDVSGGHYHRDRSTLILVLSIGIGVLVIVMIALILRVCKYKKEYEAAVFDVRISLTLFRNLKK
jgi:hypothetical protein